MEYQEFDIDEVDEINEEIEESQGEIEDTLEKLDNLPDVPICNECADEYESGGLADNLENPDLFKEYKEGEYCYREDTYGKSAWGSLKLSDTGERNLYAQRTVGREYREATDDGGHLIGTRFAGSGKLENLDAQNRDVNRGAYKAEENSWASELKAGNKVFVDVETYKREGVDRPDVYMGYSIVEDENGNRTWDAFSYQNVSRAEQAEWAESDEGKWVDDD